MIQNVNSTVAVVLIVLLSAIVIVGLNDPPKMVHRSTKVIYTIFLHMILNLSTSVITVFTLKLREAYQWTWYGALCVMAIAGMVVLIRNRRKFYFKAASQEPWRKVLLNAGMIAYISFCIGLFLLTYVR